MSTPVRRLYLRPPKYRAKKSAGSRSSSGLGVFLRDNSNEVAPFAVAWFYLLGVVLTAREELAIVIFFGMAATLSALIFFFGSKFRSFRQFTAATRKGHRSLRQRVRLGYVLAVPFAFAAWATWATWPNEGLRHRPSLWSLVIFILTVAVASGPWLFELRSKRKIVLTLDGLDRSEYDDARRDAKTLINGWVGWTGRAGLAGAKLKGLHFSRWARSIEVELRHGAQTVSWTALRMNKIETASLWTIAPGMARVDRSPTDTRRLTIRYMLSDPHEETMPPPPFTEMDDEEITLGVFEDATLAYFEWVNTLIAGLTRAGKSGMVNTLIRAFARNPRVALIGVDLKPGAPELGPWRSVFAALADTPDDALALFEKVMIGLRRRGEIMVQRGWRSWRSSVEEPYIVIIIDEIQLLDRRARKVLADITALIGAFGGIVVIATQYPVKENLLSAIKQNLDQRIGFRTADDTADRVIFGDNATRTGWSPSKLCPEGRRGSFLIRNGRHVRPVLARGWFNEEDQVIVDARTLAAHRTEIDRSTWHGELRPDIEDAVIVNERQPMLTAPEPTTQDRVLDAINIGHGTLKDITSFTGIPRSSVIAAIRQLADSGAIYQESRRAPWCPAVPDID